MKRKLLVTLANTDYINQAKQLLSSVYYNAGWDGDYMILADRIRRDHLMWFVEKGIFIKECRSPLCGETRTSKFYIFTDEFKKWDNVVFLDSDIIVRASIDKLGKIKGFAAALDTFWENRLELQILDDAQREQRGIDKRQFKKLVEELARDYNLRRPCFNTGVFAFSTDIIMKDTFSKLVEAAERYGKIVEFPDQVALNLVFYNKWKRINMVYNTYVNFFQHTLYIKPEKIKGVILHFIGHDKPWLAENFFYKEWILNLKKSDNLNVNKIPRGKFKTKCEIMLFGIYYKIHILFLSHYLLHIMKIFLREHFPTLYYNLRYIKFKILDSKNKLL